MQVSKIRQFTGYYLFLLSPSLFATGEIFTNMAKIQAAGVEITAKKNVDHSPAGLTAQGDI